ncbi:glycosyltransferase [Aquisalimonas sp. APHAB1-3]|uniref:glycosyltransferase n=1 Tax=Aquisalimonas sp. APHAB1-3 TaxID=3402080 RepID=UPI003AAA7085
MDAERYTRFEETFRGSQDEIRQRLQIYRPAVEVLQTKCAQRGALDLGCGRGEWLWLLRGYGLHARGVDANPAMVDIAREQGLEVDECDALTALAAQPDDSLALVSGFHIAEHLTFGDVQQLIEQAFRALAPGGLLILETPNPENLQVGLCGFHVDPTHHKPLPPGLLEFTAIDAGFPSPLVLRLNGPPAPAENRPLAERLPWSMAAYPDYAVLAQKRCADGAVALLGELHQIGDKRIGGIDVMEHTFRELAQRVEDLEVEIQRLRYERWWHRLSDRTRAAAASLRQPRLGRAALRQLVIGLLRVASATPWVRRPAALVLRPFPGLRGRVLRLSVHKQPPIRRYARAEDFEERLPAQQAPVRSASLAQRDAVLPRQEIQQRLRHIAIDGHFAGSYSLAVVNRNLAHRLTADYPGCNLAIHPREGEPVTSVRPVPGGPVEAETLEALIEAKSESEASVCLYHHFPPVSSPDPARGTPIALFSWEESRVRDDMVATLNRHYAGVVVTSWFVKKVLMDSGCTLPIHVITLPLRPSPLAQGSTTDDLARVQRRGEVRLLHVSSCFPRKAPDVLLEAFDALAAEFGSVHLTIKTFPNPHNRIEDWVRECVSAAHRDRVHVILEDYDADAMAALYHDADVIVLPTRGEGLNLPAIEAGEHCRPLVVTGSGAHTDFATPENAWWIRYRFDRSGSHLLSGDSVWTDPSPEHLTDVLSEVCQALLQGNPDVTARPQKLHDDMTARFFSYGASDSLLSALARIDAFHRSNRLSQLRNRPLSVSLITTWGEACGVAEYSRSIAGEFRALGDNVDILAPGERPAAAGWTPLNDVAVNYAWTYGKTPDLQTFQPQGEVVWIQHHPSFFSLNDTLRHGVASLQHRGHRVFLTLHNTRDLIANERALTEEIAACLNVCNRVFVHTLDDLNNLKRIGISDNTVLMPHGVSEPVDGLPSPPSGGLVIGTFGFLLPHKGTEQLIAAFAGLDEPRARLRLVTAVRDDPISRHELRHCWRIAERHGVADRIDWYTDFLPRREVERLLAGCHLVVMPYQHTHESSSGAVTVALAACSDVATTPAPIFEPVRDATYAIDGFDSGAIHYVLQQLRAGLDPEVRARVHAARREWLDAHRWSTLAERYRSQFLAARVSDAHTATGG